MDEFDKLLYQGAAQLPPDAAPSPEPPKPWKKPMDRVCWGLALITVTLDFLYLNVILPAIGAVLLWLGLRALRRENRGFRFAWVCATLYAALRFAAVIVLATPLDHLLAEAIDMEWQSLTGAVPFHTVVRTGVLQLLLTLTAAGLWRGLKGVFRKAGQPPKAGSAGAVTIMLFLLFPLACIGLTGWLLVGPLLLIWVLLLRSLFKLSRSLDEAGYALSPAPVRVSDGKAAALWLGILLAATALGVALSARLPLDASPVDTAPTAQTELRARLTGLGFPEDILSDLTDQEVSAFEGAKAVHVDTARRNNNGLRDDAPLVTFVEVQVADYRNVYLSSFRWEDPPALRSTDALELIPCYTASDTQGHPVLPELDTAAPIGRLLWEKDGVTYAAPLDIREPRDVSYASFFCQNDYTAYYTDFSLPAQGDNIRVCVLWSLRRVPERGLWFNYAANYIHRKSLWVYPYQSGSAWAAAGQPGSPSFSPFLWLQEWSEGLLDDEAYYAACREG